MVNGWMMMVYHEFTGEINGKSMVIKDPNMDKPMVNLW